jgi:alditol oxidase
MQEWNWAANYRYGAAGLHYPKTVEDLQEIVSRSEKVRALGSRHSFNAIADSEGELVSLSRLRRVFELNEERRTVTIDGGARYGEICRDLHARGFAVPNMASLPHISVAGACATATHGSGVKNQVLAAAVLGLEMVLADGSLACLSREANGEVFDGAVVGLGALGIVTRLTLDLVPAFDIRQDVFEDLPFDALDDQLEEVLQGGYSVSLFTDWKSGLFLQVWRKSVVTDGDGFAEEETWLGMRRATSPVHPIAELSAESCTPQMGLPGPWHERLPHFRFEHTPSSGEELQSEYLVPRQHAIAALKAMESLGPRIGPLLQISEVRTVAEDRLWMSPCYRQPCIAIHFTWVKDWRAVREILPDVEAALEPFDARPHWGKLFTMDSVRVRSLYSKLAEFRGLAQAYDPGGKFSNAFLKVYVL